MVISQPLVVAELKELNATAKEIARDVEGIETAAKDAATNAKDAVLQLKDLVNTIKEASVVTVAAIGVAAESLAAAAASLKDIALCLKPEVESIVISPSTPVPRTTTMETKPTIKLVKKSAHLKALGGKPIAKAKSGDVINDFVYQDNEDCTFTVLGLDTAGNTVDISAVATLTPPPTSSDPTCIAVDPPSGMTVVGHGIKVSTPGTPVVLTATATWNDSSRGPYVFTLPVDVISGGPTGIVVIPGTPTVRT